MLKTGTPPFHWTETVEMIKVIIAAQISLSENNRIVYLDEIPEK